MRFLSLTLALIACASITTTTLSAGTNDERETMVSIDLIPAPARDAIRAKLAGFTITDVEVETENGVTTYEGSALSSGEEIEAKVDAEGHLIADDGDHQDSAAEDDEDDEMDGEDDNDESDEDGDEADDEADDEDDDQEHDDGDDQDEADGSEHENEGEEHGDH